MGLGTDVPVSADFDGDDKTDIAVYRPSTGVWWIMKSSTGFDGTHVAHSWGNYGDQPVPADYDGDGDADLAVWRPKTGVWYIAKSSEDFEEHEYHSLGVTGNTAIPSAYLKQVGATVYGDDMANARLSPKNATGGTNLYSQNFSWGTSLVGLPGRSGLDAGFGISYNSLVWTKLGSEMHFDVDQGNVGPGFRLGFPTIEPVYYNEVTAKHSFLMVTPSGARVEFRQIGAGNSYETADSSYTLLKIKEGQTYETPIEEIDLTVITTDGTQMTYEWLGGAYRCKEIKDRNGNFITIVHDEDGTLRTVTDTLGREITVHYDSQLYPTSITQTWKDTNGSGSNITHTWASFTYTTKTVATNFGSLTVVGPPNDTVIKVLQKITYADGSYTKFRHNGYVQVDKIQNYSATDVELNRVATNLDSVSGSQADCPRFTETRSYAKDFNGGSDVIVNNSAPDFDEFTLPGGGTADAALVTVDLEDHPHELFTRIYFADSGWSEGLQLASEECTGSSTSTCSTQRRFTRTYWTQDNTGVDYLLNPRVTDSRVSNGVNTKRITIDYWLENETSGPAIFGLVKSAYTYDADLTTILRKTYTEYNLASEYTSRRIIGLPSVNHVYGVGGTNLVAKTTYAYDFDDDFAVSGLNQSITPTQHDSTSYGATFSAGRGNLTKTLRWNVDYPTLESAAIKTETIYNVAGSPVAQITPWETTNTRTVRIGYSDVWNDGVSRATYAYPTTVTDPSSNTLGDSAHSSTVKYRYDIGANVEANSPAPEGHTYGKRTVRTYDDLTGRLLKDALWKHDPTGPSWSEHSYTRYEYPTNGTQSKVFTTPTETTTTPGPDAADEVLSESFTDGGGRVIKSRVPHTFSSSGSTLTWAATKIDYDILGRVVSQSVPTEADEDFDPTGDDSQYLWTSQEYDWMNRIVRKINTDGSLGSANDSDILISYDGCSCAGASTMTIESERVPIPDTSNYGRRKQKIFQDILGRTTKTETFDWNGNVYSTVVNAYNERDEVTSITQYEGTTSGTSQVTTMTYDGHSRVATRHLPQQSANASTSYLYNPDNSISEMTDARGATTYYSYNSRGLVFQISYTVPGNSGIPETPTVEFEYDNVGNRIMMEDGLGTVTYSYNSFSQLTAELRNFDDTLTSAPETNNGYKFEYTYHMGGGLKTLKEPFGTTAVYGFDKIGRLTSVAPSTSYGGTTSFASNAQYRAFGGLKHLEYGNGVVMDTTFNDRLQPETYTLGTSTVDVMEKTYQYYPDGRLKHVDDALNWRFDRLNVFDHQGRLQYAKSSSEANGTEIPDNTWPQVQNLPYRQSYSYNAFGDLTQRYSKLWGADVNLTTSYTFVNHRIVGQYSWEQWQYDADGRVTQQTTPEPLAEFEYNAAGQLVLKHDKREPTDHEDKYESFYDGNGREVKRVTDQCRKVIPNPPEEPPEDCSWWGATASYMLRSSVIGGEVITTAGAGGNLAGRVVLTPSGEKLGILSHRYTWNPDVTHDAAQFYHADPSGFSQRVSRNYPEALLGQPSWDPNYIDPRQHEYEPGGANIGLVTNYVQQPAPPSDPMVPIDGDAYIFADGQWGRVYLDGLPINRQAVRMMGLGGALQVPSGFLVLGRSVMHLRPVDVEEVNGQLTWNYVRGVWSRRTNEHPGFRILGTDIGWMWTSVGGISSSGGGAAQSKSRLEEYQFLGDEAERIKAIQGIIDFAKSKSECTKAFESVGATPIANQLRNLVIVTQRIFGEPLYDSTNNWTRGTGVGTEMRDTLREVPTTKDVSTIGTFHYLRTSDYAWSDSGIRFLGVTESAFDRSEYLSVVIIHSLLHTGGVRGQRPGILDRVSVMPSSVSDLTYLGEKYREVLKHCTRERGSKHF